MKVMSQYATIKRVGSGCEVGDFRTLARSQLKDLKSWNIQLTNMSVQENKFHKRENTPRAYYTLKEKILIAPNLGKKLVFTNKSVLIKRLNSDIIEKKNSVSVEKRRTLKSYS